MHRLADLDGAVVGLLLAGDHAEQRGLAGAVRPDDADDAARRQLEGEIVDQEIAAKTLAQMVEGDDVLPEPFGDRNDDLRGLGLLLAGLRQQLLVALVARLRLGLPRARRSGDPFLLARERALVRLVLAAFLLEPLLFLHQPRRVIALVGNAAAAVELENPAGDVVEEVAVVGDDEDGARIAAQMPLEPHHRLGVEMIGGLVEQQKLRLLQQKPAQRHPAPLAAGELPRPRHRPADNAKLPSPDRPWS